MKRIKPVMAFYPSTNQWTCRSFKESINTFIVASENWGIAYGAWYSWQMLNPGR